jgi:hypothetical protein
MAEAYLAGQQTVNVTNTTTNTYPTYNSYPTYTTNNTYTVPAVFALVGSGETKTVSISTCKYCMLFFSRTGLTGMDQQGSIPYALTPGGSLVLVCIATYSVKENNTSYAVSLNSAGTQVTFTPSISATGTYLFALMPVTSYS